MTVGDANNKWILTEDTKHVINVCMLMRYDGQVHFVKDDALLSKVPEIMRQIMALYNKNGWEFSLFYLDNGHAEIRGLLDLKEEFDV